MSENSAPRFQSKPYAPDFEAFSDQVYRHRRNLLTYSVIILICTIWGGELAQLPFGIKLNQHLAKLDLLLFALQIYFLIVFWSAAMAEFKSWPDRMITIPILTSDGGMGGSQSPQPFLSATTEKFIENLNRLREEGNRDEIEQDEVTQLKALLREYNSYQRSALRWCHWRYIIDLFFPLFLGIITAFVIFIFVCSPTQLIKISTSNSEIILKLNLVTTTAATYNFLQ